MTEFKLNNYDLCRWCDDIMLIPINLLDTSRANYAVYGFGIVTSKNAYDLSNPVFYSAVCLVTC